MGGYDDQERYWGWGVPVDYDTFDTICTRCGWRPGAGWPCHHKYARVNYRTGNNEPPDDFEQEYDHDYEPPYWP